MQNSTHSTTKSTIYSTPLLILVTALTLMWSPSFVTGQQTATATEGKGEGGSDDVASDLMELDKEEGRLAPVAVDGEDPHCTTSPSHFWICQGDPAWTTGYLVSPQVFDLRLLPIWEKKVKHIIPRLMAERLILKAQRDSFKASLGSKDAQIINLQAKLATTQAQADELYDGWQVASVGLVSFAGGVLATLSIFFFGLTL